MKNIGGAVQISAGLVAILWVVFFADALLPGDWRGFGLRPRDTEQIWGVLTTPFLHGNLKPPAGQYRRAFRPADSILRLQPQARFQSIARYLAAWRGSRMGFRKRIFRAYRCERDYFRLDRFPVVRRHLPKRACGADMFSRRFFSLRRRAIFVVHLLSRSQLVRPFFRVRLRNLRRLGDQNLQGLTFCPFFQGDANTNGLLRVAE